VAGTLDGEAIQDALGNWSTVMSANIFYAVIVAVDIEHGNREILKVDE
jgi:hypothetical protein